MTSIFASWEYYKKGTEEIESYTYDNYGNRERGVLFCDGA